MLLYFYAIMKYFCTFKMNSAFFAAQVSPSHPIQPIETESSCTKRAQKKYNSSVQLHNDASEVRYCYALYCIDICLYML